MIERIDVSTPDQPRWLWQARTRNGVVAHVTTDPDLVLTERDFVVEVDDGYSGKRNAYGVELLDVGGKRVAFWCAVDGY